MSGDYITCFSWQGSCLLQAVTQITLWLLHGCMTPVFIASIPVCQRRYFLTFWCMCKKYSGEIHSPLQVEGKNGPKINTTVDLAFEFL